MLFILPNKNKPREMTVKLHKTRVWTSWESCLEIRSQVPGLHRPSQNTFPFSNQPHIDGWVPQGKIKTLTLCSLFLRVQLRSFMFRLGTSEGKPGARGLPSYPYLQPSAHASPRRPPGRMTHSPNSLGASRSPHAFALVARTSPFTCTCWDSTLLYGPGQNLSESLPQFSNWKLPFLPQNSHSKDTGCYWTLLALSPATIPYWLLSPWASNLTSEAWASHL